MRTWVALAVLVLSAHAAHAADLWFVAPDGFHAIGEDRLPMLTAMSTAVPRARRTLAVADEEGGGLRAVMTAWVVPAHDGESVELPSPRDLEVQARRNATNEGRTLATVEARSVKVRGVDAIRFTSTTAGDRGERHVVYYLPGADQLGIVTCISSVEDAAHYDPLFQAALQNTVGLEQPAWWAHSMNRLHTVPLGNWPGLPVFVGGGIGFLSWRRRRNRQRAAAGLPPRY